MKQKLGLVFLHYIRILAKLQLVKLNLFRKILGKDKIKIVGITGSAGKTSTMLSIASALKRTYRVKYSRKANSESGIPLNILGLQMKNFRLQDWFRAAFLGVVKLITNWQNYDIYVVEMGVDEPKPPKNMEYLLKIIRPEIGVFTCVTPVHAMQFEKNITSKVSGEFTLEVILDAIADEKAKLISALPKEGTAVLNFDDHLIKERKKLTLAEVIGVGKDDDSKIKLINYQVNLRKTQFKYQITGENNYRTAVILDNFVVPPAYGINLGLSLGVAQALGVELEDAVEGIEEDFVLPPGRSSLIKGIKDTYIIDSSYNASPAAMETMLDLLDKLGKKTGRKKVAVLGDMRELGTRSKEEHEKLAEKAIETVDKIVTVGPEMKKYFLPKASSCVLDPLRREASGELKLTAYNTAGEAAEYLENNLEGGELVLVKGSQNTIFLEIVVKALMADPSQAEEILCRRGEYWKHLRKPYR
jgi:UDP-N-acetylmuramoyl-tripeptide--D-alanyl-D-alanine ligase